MRGPLALTCSSPTTLAAALAAKRVSSSALTGRARPASLRAKHALLSARLNSLLATDEKGEDSSSSSSDRSSKSKQQEVGKASSVAKDKVPRIQYGNCSLSKLETSDHTLTTFTGESSSDEFGATSECSSFADASLLDDYELEGEDDDDDEDGNEETIYGSLRVDKSDKSPTRRVGVTRIEV